MCCRLPDLPIRLGTTACAYPSVMATAQDGTDSVPLRIATWNCGSALRRGLSVLDELAADVVVLQSVSAGDLDAIDGSLFVGPAGKGLAAVPFNGWSFTPSPEDPELPGLLYCRVMSPVGTHVVDLAAIWALTGRDVPTYTEQFAAVLSFAATRESTMPLIIAGDLNASAQGPEIALHAANLETARQLGLVSSYHHVNAIAHGAEPTMTLRWWGRGGEECGYHCDFIFCSEELADSASAADVGEWATWVDSERSDHAPVVATFTI